MNQDRRSDFEKAAAEKTEGGLVKDFWQFLLQNKKWWLVPILVMLVVFGALVLLSGTGLAPFIYTLF